VDFAVVALEPESRETLPDSAAVDRGEDAGVALAPAANELGAVGFAGEGLDPDSDVAAEALRSADPDDEGVLPAAAAVFGVGPLAGGIPNPAGETGFPAAEEPAAEDAEPAIEDVDPTAAAPDAGESEAADGEEVPDDEPGTDAGDAPPRAEDATDARAGSPRAEDVGAPDAAPGAELAPAVGTADGAAVDVPGRGVDTCDAAPDDVGAVAPLPAESVSTGPSGSNN